MEISIMTFCTDEDFRQIETLIGVLSTSCKANREIIDEVIAKEDSHLFVARNEEGKIVGMTTVCCFTIPTGRHATIEDVVVLPECQGTGLGRRLVGRSPGEGKGNTLQYSCLDNPLEEGAWQSTIHGVTKELDTT